CHVGFITRPELPVLFGIGKDSAGGPENGHIDEDAADEAKLMDIVLPLAGTAFTPLQEGPVPRPQDSSAEKERKRRNIKQAHVRKQHHRKDEARPIEDARHRPDIVLSWLPCR